MRSRTLLRSLATAGLSLILLSACSRSGSDGSATAARTDSTEAPASTAATPGSPDTIVDASSAAAAETTADASAATTAATTADATAGSATPSTDGLGGLLGGEPGSPRAGGAGGGVGGPGGSCTANGASPQAAPAGAVPKVADGATVAAAVTSATAFLDGLNDAQRTLVTKEFTDLDQKRCSWSNFPSGIFNGRVGVRLGDLDDAQRAAAMQIVKSLMSAAGYTYAQAAIAGDQYLADTEGQTQMGTDNYYLALYGTPSKDMPWTLQFGGHHLAIHISVGGDVLSISPYFKGLQPISYEVAGARLEAMKGAADHLFGLFESLDAEQRKAATLAGGYDDLVMGPGADVTYPQQEGLSYGDLTAAQQALVRGAIRDWVGDAAPELAQPLIDLYESQLAQTKVAWSTSFDRGSSAYMRIDGPRVWIEWVNTTAGGGLHYHTVYRDKLLDYGTGSAG